MFRFFFSIYYLFKYKAFIKKQLISSNCVVSTVLDINSYFCRLFCIKFIMLDFDGVLSSHNDVNFDENVFYWLKFTYEIYGKSSLCVYSNNIFISRILFLKKIGIVNTSIGFRKKPYPDFINNVLNNKKLLYHEIILIDDRISTGILAASIAMIRWCLVKNPYLNIKGNFFVELFYIFLRKLENLFLLV